MFTSFDPSSFVWWKGNPKSISTKWRKMSFEFIIFPVDDFFLFCAWKWTPSISRIVLIVFVDHLKRTQTRLWGRRSLTLQFTRSAHVCRWMVITVSVTLLSFSLFSFDNSTKNSYCFCVSCVLSICYLRNVWRRRMKITAKLTMSTIRWFSSTKNVPSFGANLKKMKKFIKHLMRECLFVALTTIFFSRHSFFA